ncbi:ZIP family metal transporter [Verrucomicrobia bacterium]|jgi:solute carrier family 39 (zinc transporter), member 9|nr:ZIP family metal transporter [Verrucomicrobiota bacterium]MDB4745730.1 ZIP family metal transporter [Verrucomicrobiota bacterium]MDB4796674.1 ZIP family metal transporter [bacterium]
MRRDVAPYRGLTTAVLMLVGCFVLVGCGPSSNLSGGADNARFAYLIAFITFVAAFAGGAFPLLARLDHQHSLLGSMTSVSAGFLVAAACLIVIPEGFERFSTHPSAPISSEEPVGQDPTDHDHSAHAHSHAAEDGGFSIGLEPSLTAGLAILMGFLLMLVTESLGFGHDIHEEHHDHAGGHVHHPASGANGKQLAAVVVIGLTIHTIADGMAIGAGLATGSHALTGSLVATLLTHKIPAAFSLTMFSQHAHGSRRRTWKDLLVFSLATPVAIIGTWTVLGSLSDQVVGLVLLFSAGTFIYVATIDVLPNVLHSSRRRVAAFQVVIGCVSLLLFIVLLDAFGFSLHDHG